MSLTSHPFHPVTQELLPGYRDAYLRGDLSGKNNDLVNTYFKANPDKGVEAFQRFHTLKEKGHDVRPVGWLQHQFDLIRTEPVRFRQRAASMLLVAGLVGGAAFASNNRSATPAVSLRSSVLKPVTAEEVTAATEAAEATAALASMSTITGRILDENGHALVGATVIDKESGRGVSTDIQGNYSLAVPTNRTSTLQVGYGGYSEDELQVKGRSVQNVTLLPRLALAKQRKSHWWQF
ncbi:carboxypeptidase-like regulatory domain-containing protein [Hymenobacter canadensis]|uniref:Carboxypeptidase-like regulatory domain-containing protein n=1 Tax=Hymenobacter canadensis TaxID=2999067 RepID=A0ABY7LYC8_9BACT|nr:carboxypeptidase-like regulatory domain-containing protein [Hymenobacter canadensis]WBA43958.1 carboxypeptidase-like regulatory domain-containing protein [Hymenobacter canadensis]